MRLEYIKIATYENWETKAYGDGAYIGILGVWDIQTLKHRSIKITKIGI